MVRDFLFLRRARNLLVNHQDLNSGNGKDDGSSSSSSKSNNIVRRPGGLLSLLLSLLESDPAVQRAAYRRFLSPERFPQAYR